MQIQCSTFAYPALTTVLVLDSEGMLREHQLQSSDEAGHGTDGVGGPVV